MWSQLHCSEEESAAETSDGVLRMLSGMAADTSRYAAGGILLNSTAGDSEGSTEQVDMNDDSLMNCMVARRVASTRIVQEMIRACQDTSWQILCGDIVYIEEEFRPMRVFRIGFGEYEREVRVASMLDDTSKWSTGMWVRTDRLHKLDYQDSLLVIADLVDATEAKNVIKKGSVCTFLGWDDDGDALVCLRIGGVTLSTVIFAADFEKLTLR